MGYILALCYALRLTVECYLGNQSKSNYDTKTGYTFNKTVASVPLGVIWFIQQNDGQQFFFQCFIISFCTEWNGTCSKYRE